MNKNTGGPAFPMMTKWRADHHGKAANTGYEVSEYSEGMTLRDHFAGLAMQSVYSDYLVTARKLGFDENWELEIAIDAYKMADAMLAEREKGND